MEKEMKKEAEYEFGDMYVKYTNSFSNFVYNGDTCAKAVPVPLRPFSSRQVPAFTVTEGSDIVDMRKNYVTITTKQQCFLSQNFEELRERFFSPASTDVPSKVDALPGDKYFGNSKIERNFSSTHQLFRLAARLLTVKKRNLSYLAMNLEGTTAQQSERMKNICDSVKYAEPVVQTSASAGQVLNNSTCTNETLSTDKPLSTKEPSSSEGSVEVGHDSSKICGPPEVNVDTCCLHCSLQVNLSKTLEKLQECLDIGLNVCERLEDVLKDLRDLISPNFSFGKRFRKASLAELRCALLLSSHILKLQTLHGSHLNKMHTLLLSLSASKKDIHETAKISMASGTQSSTSNCGDTSAEKQVPLEEKLVLKTGTSEAEETLDQSPSDVCQLSSNFQTPFGIPELRQFLKIFTIYTKMLRPLEKSIIGVVCHFLEKEETSLQKSLENITEALEFCPKEDISLEHSRNPFEKSVLLLQLFTIKTSDKLMGTYSGQSNIVLPNGEGRLSTVDKHVLYEGEWKLGKKDGYGKAFLVCETHPYLTSSKGEYHGSWRSNARHGFGHMVFSDGSVYNGEWYMDQIHGNGVLTSFDGCILEGFWLNGNPNGCITFTWPHGATEYREYRQGNILRVYDPRHDLSPSLKTLKSIESTREENLYYKNCFKSLQEKMGVFKDDCEEKGKRLFTCEREEKLQVVDLLQRELEQSQRLQKEEAKKTEELRRKLDCHICMNRPKDCLLLPCLHFNYCARCIEQLKAKETSLKCPTCRQLTNGEIHCKFS